MEDLTYQKYIKRLGKTEPVRRWLMTMFLTTSYHVTTRPISEANVGFFRRMAKVNDRLMDLLKEQGWPMLEEEIEYGFTLMEKMASKDPTKEVKAVMKRDFKKNYKRYFKAINPPWSELTPDSTLNVQELWPNPKEILVAFGANSGIGDELVYYRLIRRLHTMYPDAKISLVSYQNTMWDLCPWIERIEYHKNDQLAPFMAALDVMERDANNMVVFSEFASVTIYRHLEGFDLFKRFVYMDTGSKTVRVVDNESGRILDHFVKKASTMYHVLNTLMDTIGLTNEQIHAERSLPIREKEFNLSDRKRIYLNPFTSKDYKVITPDWWAAALKTLAGYGSFELEVFEGINEVSMNYAAAIIDQIKDIPQIKLIRNDEIPSIAETIDKAANSDLVFGIDTFTGHIGIVQTTPCLTVFLGSQWHLWKIPDNYVVNADASDEPDKVGVIASLMLFPMSEKCRAYAAELVEITNQIIKEKPPRLETLRYAITRGKAIVASWVEEDERVNAFAVDVSPGHFLLLEKAFMNGEPNMEDKAVLELIKQSFGMWMDSNLHRYCRYLTYLEDKQLISIM